MALAVFMNCAEVLSNINSCREFFTWTTSGIRRALRNRNPEQLPVMISDETENLDTKVGQLEPGLWKLKTTMPKMLNLIDQAEWQSHKKEAADLIPHIKDAVYDAEDLLDEFDYYALKLMVESSKSLGHDHLHDSFLEFFGSAASSDYIRQINEIQAKLDHVHAQFMAMGLHQPLQKFDKLVRPDTSSFLEPKIAGREKELKLLVGRLGVRVAPNRGRAETEARMTELHVVPIVGMGGIGKTTMAQQICNNAKVKKHFDHVIWTCVSDDFDIIRLAKEIIEQLLEENISSNNLNFVMSKLEDCVKSKRFLLVLDDMWEDVLKQDAAWTLFCERLKNGAQGSRILVTTRWPNVANHFAPEKDQYKLQGLQDAIFWEIFVSFAFGSMDSCKNREALEGIGKKIVPKLKGSPLAASTIGRLLSMDLSTEHWENIMDSELWRVEEQKETDILPALRLSYLYLPQKQKRCFSICAMYPKDHKFGKGFLADIWIAQGYVANPQEASVLFNALANRSFFQKASANSIKYVIHDLMHDTAQLVSKDECFTIKHASDIDKVPSNVRHLSLFGNGNVKCSELERICQKKKLRSLVCDESNNNATDFPALIDCCFKELLKIRLLRFKVTSVFELPESMGNSKHLRYFCLLGSNHVTFPSSIRHLHHLKIIESGISSFERFPQYFSDAISLQELRSGSLTYIKDSCDKLCLNWKDTLLDEELMEYQMEVIPHWNLQHLKLEYYKGQYFPSWLCPNVLPRLSSLEFGWCNKFNSMPFFGPLEVSLDNTAQGFLSLTRISISACSSLTSIPLHVWSSNVPSLEELDIALCDSLASIGVCDESTSSSGGSGVKGFSNLTKIRIRQCKKLLSLDEFLTPDYLPIVKIVSVTECEELTSLSVDRLDGLQDLEISKCPKLISQRVMAFPSSLKKLQLGYCDGIESININNSQLSNSSELEKLIISACQGLKSIGGATTIHKIKDVSISECPNLNDIQQPLSRSDLSPPEEGRERMCTRANSRGRGRVRNNANVAEASVRGRAKGRKRSADASTSGTRTHIVANDRRGRGRAKRSTT